MVQQFVLLGLGSVRKTHSCDAQLPVALYKEAFAWPLSFLTGGEPPNSYGNMTYRLCNFTVRILLQSDGQEYP